MPDSNYIPTDSDLLAYNQGLLPEERIEAITNWLEDHPEGEERLQRLSEGKRDYAVEALRQPGNINEELKKFEQLTSRVINAALRIPSTATSSEPIPECIRDYRIIRKLGAGGMAVVYLAHHNRLKREVAIKLLPERLAGDKEFRGRFEREMAVIGQLSHPNLPHAYDAGVEGNYCYLVMELLDGQNLEKIVRERGPLSVADACEAARQTALGLEYAHQHNIVHRDIKPSNVFLTRQGIVKVIDLGLARATDQQLRANVVSSVHTVMGTPEFMAPEQWQNPQVSSKTDIYSLGCTLFFFLTGRPPFSSKDGRTWVDLLEAHRYQPPPDLRTLRPDVDRGLADLVTRMLSKSPNGRPDSGAKLVEALSAFTAGHALANLLSESSTQPASKPRISKNVPLSHRLRRYWWIPIPILLVLAAIALFWPGSPGGSQRTDTETPTRTKAPAGSGEYSLSLIGHDHVRIEKSVGLLDLNESFTVEMWVKFDKKTQYFVSDEVWRGIGEPGIERTHGWVLRIEDSNSDRINFSAASREREWFASAGPMISFDEHWHHLALSKSKDVVGIFLDGRAYLTLDPGKTTFVNSPFELCIGSRLLLPTRTINSSFRAFRISSKQLYSGPFTPPEHLERTSDTLVLLDFSVGEGDRLPDLSGNAHDGVLNGGLWSPASP